MRINQKESTEISEFQLGFVPREILPKIWDWGVPPWVLHPDPI